MYHLTGMKYKLFTWGFILMSFYSWSQKPVITKVYAYAQETMGGVRPQPAINENGKEQPAGTLAKKNYLV